MAAVAGCALACNSLALSLPSASAVPEPLPLVGVPEPLGEGLETKGQSAELERRDGCGFAHPDSALAGMAQKRGTTVEVDLDPGYAYCEIASGGVPPVAMPPGGDPLPAAGLEP